MAEIRPIDDIRSTAKYRAAVAGNLVVDFLNRLTGGSTTEHSPTNPVLREWNRLPPDQAVKAILPCCGSRSWAQQLSARRPFADESAVLSASNEIWHSLAPSEWLEGFQGHPRIGESQASQAQTAQSVEWSAQEQQSAQDANLAARNALANANHEYECRFGRIFITCATGKSSAEILNELQRRLHNDPETEIREAADQQRQIMEIRLKKWLRT